MADRKPGPIPKEALAYLRAKKLEPGFDYRDVWRESHATAFTVAKAMQVDVLESIRDSLDQALAEGRTFAQFKKDLTPTLQKLGWWGESDETDPVTGETRTVQLGSPRRLKTIYDTNKTIAYQSGQWQRIQRNKKSFPYLKYVLGPSKEHRAEHVAWAGTILPVDDPWWASHKPKNGWGCNCDVISLTEAQAQREGISSAPQVKMRKWENERTGEVLDVPVGIDPGWDFNPGQVAHDEYAARIFGNKIKTASPEVGSLAMQSAGDYVRAAMQDDFKRWVKPLFNHQQRHVGEARLVSVVSADVIHALRQQGLALDSAGITLKDRAVEHFARDQKKSPLPESEVLALPARLDNPKAVLLDAVDNMLVYVFDLPQGKLAKVVIQPGWKGNARIDGKREKVQLNAIVTATAVQPSNLPGERYRVIKGSL